MFENHVFIENKGQFFDEEQKAIGKPILYGTRMGKLHLYYTATSLVFRYDSIVPKAKDDNEGKTEEEEKSFSTIHEFMSINWDGANPNATIEVQLPTTDYFTYGDPKDKTGHTSITARAWQRLVYKNLYPNIDVEFYYPEKGGIEYDIIVHPGGDISKVKMHYSNNALASLIGGNIRVLSPCTNLTDHAPTATTQDGKSVVTSFALSNNCVTFKTGDYDKNQTLKIDPWIYTTTYPVSNKAYIIDYDLQGNVYAYGGYYPYQEIKLGPTGLPIWTYTTTFAYTYSAGYSFFGGFCIDCYTGKGFMSEGFNTGGAQVLSVNSSGAQLSLLNGISSYDEIWTMRFNACIKKGVMIGGGTASPSMQTCLLDTTNTVLNAVQTIPTSHMDLSCLAVDNLGSCYVMSDSNFSAPPPTLFKAPLASLTTPNFSVASGYGFPELLAVNYCTGINVGLTYAGTNGYNGLATSSDLLYSFDGAVLKKWNPVTGTVLLGKAIYPTPYLSGGIWVDNCNHVFIGSNTNVLEYDSTFTLLNTYPMPDTVYDVRIGPGNILADNMLYASGNTFVTAVHIKRITTAVTATGTCSCSGTATANSCGQGPFSYVWSDGQTTQTATNLCLGTYTVTVTDEGHCIPVVDTAIVTITGGAGSFSVTTVAQNAKCFGQKNGVGKVNPVGTPPYTYQWSTGATTQSDSNLAPGTYTCIVTQSGGCTDTVKITIAQPVKLSLTSNSVPDTCGGASDGSASVTVAGGTKPYNYTWNTGATTTTVTGLSSGSYSVIVLDSNICKDTAFINVNVVGGKIPISSKNAKCFGLNDGQAIVTPKGAGPYTYSWNTGATTKADTGLSAGTYTCIIVQPGGCTDTESVTVGQPKPISITRGSTPDSCNGVKPVGSATALASGGISPYTYTWSNGGTGGTVGALSSGTYTVTVHDSNSCPDTAIINVHTVGAVTVGFIGDSLTGCAPLCVTFTDTANPVGQKITQWFWNFGDKDTSSAKVPRHCYANPGTYSVTLTVAAAGGCSSSVTIPNYITVYSKPNVNFTSTPQPANILLDPTVQFIDLSTDKYGISGWYWRTFGDTSGATSTLQNPTHTYGDTGTFCPTLIVTNKHGCIDSATHCTEVQPVFALYIPNAFTPNGLGLNGTFAAKGVGIRTLEMWIFNRWGQIIYHTTNMYNGWNGSYNNNGNPAQEDTYVYMINAVDVFAQTHSYIGRVTLIR